MTVALIAWIGLATMLAMQASHARVGQPSPWWCMPGMGAASHGPHGPAPAAPLTAAADGLPMWSLMAFAMMMPAAIPATRHVAVNSLSWRRGRAVCGFLTIYVLVWLTFGFAAIAGLAALPGLSGGPLLAAALAVAATWELTPLKRLALNRCHSTSPLPPRGRRAHLGIARFALRHGAACVVSCWATMIVMLTAQSGRLLWSVTLAGTTAADKLSLKPRRSTRACAALLGAAAAAASLRLMLE